MSPKIALRFLGGTATILFYLLLLFAAYYIIVSVAAFFNVGAGATQYERFSYTVKQFGLGDKESEFQYSPDSLVKYKAVPDNFTIQLKPRSTISYYAFAATIILLGFTLLIVNTTRKLFKQANIDRPFRPELVLRLRHLAWLFILLDVFSLINYFIFSAFLTASFQSLRLRFELFTTVGNGFVTGIIIWIIAVIFQRGIELQEENALTV